MSTIDRNKKTMKKIELMMMHDDAKEKTRPGARQWQQRQRNKTHGTPPSRRCQKG
jgi:hypothetical protein